MEARKHARTVVFVALGFGVGIGALGFRSVDAAEPRPGLEAYRPDAVAAVDPERSNDAAEHSNAEITVVMEVRNVCREVALYVRSGAKDPDGLAERLRAGGERTKQAPTAEGEGSPDIDQFVEFALGRVAEARKAGSTKPLVEFIESECDPRQDYSAPILATDS